MEILRRQTKILVTQYWQPKPYDWLGLFQGAAHKVREITGSNYDSSIVAAQNSTAIIHEVSTEERCTW